MSFMPVGGSGKKLFTVTGCGNSCISIEITSWVQTKESQNLSLTTHLSALSVFSEKSLYRSMLKASITYFFSAPTVVGTEKQS